MNNERTILSLYEITSDIRQVIAERYKLAKELGDGTFGVVLLATRVDTNEKVAVKR